MTSNGGRRCEGTEAILAFSHSSILRPSQPSTLVSNVWLLEPVPTAPRCGATAVDAADSASASGVGPKIAVSLPGTCFRSEMRIFLPFSAFCATGSVGSCP